DSIKAGENTFVLNKTHSTGAYSSILVYLYNSTDSNEIKNVYIYNGADLVGMTGNGANRPISVDSVLKVDSSNVASAIAYIFGAGAKDDRASIVVNGERDDDAWNTNLSDQVNIYTKDISKTVKDDNEISIILNNNMFTALQQIVVVTKAPEKIGTKITASSVSKVYNVNKKFTATLKDANNKAISNVKVTITLNGKTYSRTTNAKGQVTLDLPNLAPKTYKVSIKFAGDSKYKASSLNTAKVVVKKATPKMTAKKKTTFKAKTKVKKLTVTLKTNKGKVMKKVKLTLKIKKKTYKATTNTKGKAIFKITKLTKKGTYTGKVTYNGNKYYNKVTKSVKIAVKK
ncbi:Ig-like domain repeat protein, partial [Methanobrevibacter sp.]|uniref:Ig-like domain repeat protein n=1 Tax=Methanobrevibacter sp. TaxID=66852 RepID=UPI0038647E8D